MSRRRSPASRSCRSPATTRCCSTSPARTARSSPATSRSSPTPTAAPASARSRAARRSGATLEEAGGVLVGQPVARYRSLLREVATPLRRPRRRRPRAADLRPAHHRARRHRPRVRPARPARPAPRRARGRAARRRPAARRACRCWATCSSSATATRTDLAYLREPDGADDWERLRREEALTPDAVVAPGRGRRRRATASRDFKLKGGVLAGERGGRRSSPRSHERFPDARITLDPNGGWLLAEAIRLVPRPAATCSPTPRTRAAPRAASPGAR